MLVRIRDGRHKIRRLVSCFWSLKRGNIEIQVPLHVHRWCLKVQEEDNNARTRSDVHQRLNIHVCDTATPDTIDFSVRNQNRNHSHESWHQMKKHNCMTVSSLRVAIGQVKLSANNTNRMCRHDPRPRAHFTVMICSASCSARCLQRCKSRHWQTRKPNWGASLFQKFLARDANSPMFTGTLYSSSLQCQLLRYDATTPQIKTMRDANM